MIMLRRLVWIDSASRICQVNREGLNCSDMSPEEKPPPESQANIPEENPRPDSNASDAGGFEGVKFDLVEAELVSDPGGVVEATIVESQPDFLTDGDSRKYPQFIPPPQVDRNLENIAANGGAVGALVLGIWSLIGSFITNWSMINGVLGLLLGVWGLTSRRKRLAWTGILLCVVSILLSMIQVNEFIQLYLNRVDESQL